MSGFHPVQIDNASSWPMPRERQGRLVPLVVPVGLAPSALRRFQEIPISTDRLLQILLESLEAENNLVHGTCGQAPLGVPRVVVWRCQMCALCPAVHAERSERGRIVSPQSTPVRPQVAIDWRGASPPVSWRPALEDARPVINSRAPLAAPRQSAAIWPIRPIGAGVRAPTALVSVLGDLARASRLCAP